MTIEKELFELEKQYWQAIKDKDAEAAMRLSDETCIVVGAQGIGRIEKRALARMIEHATYELNDFQLQDDVHIQMLGDDVAVLAYVVKEQLTVDGAPVTIEAADASTWVRRDGAWRCALHTESLRGDPFGRDRSSRGS